MAMTNHVTEALFEGTPMPASASAAHVAPERPSSKSFENGAFEGQFFELLRWRRDVRRFLTDPVPEAILDRLVEAACLAPSVGLSQPWRFIIVDTAARREAIQAEFEVCNQSAASAYEGEQAAHYRTLKLAGLVEAPAHLAVCCDLETSIGHGLGRKTQPETLRDSVVCAIHTLWLTARIHGLGVGWVSILRPAIVHDILELPRTWHLVAYLCIGWPAEPATTPELERLGWESRKSTTSFIVRR
jgi:5,6-dimethylbenzimidazole synthase